MHLVFKLRAVIDFVDLSLDRRNSRVESRQDIIYLNTIPCPPHCRFRCTLKLGILQFPLLLLNVLLSVEQMIYLWSPFEARRQSECGCSEPAHPSNSRQSATDDSSKEAVWIAKPRSVNVRPRM